MRLPHDPVSRALAGHALANTAMGLPWPLLLLMVADATAQRATSAPLSTTAAGRASTVRSASGSLS
jgi:hypothetical protein